ncbi:alpha/beta hydrolase [Kibdelosporangium philippinense]|uniref:Alpha/beta hydrolase n=1 Tax=Kibdelosporangium philippinense TaxID=211113 RepID=A0ABS8ZLN6_9PSEU|nr:alpha/beta fold hydrolase [Kibdelosporangium philippinense]MCE7006702.1 alpha/beta hydrolase [Kibdelosporangium philippinense]
MKRIVVTVVAAGLALSGASVANAAPKPTGFQPKPISWGQCANTRLQGIGAQCGLLEVPLDYAKPGGKKIKIAVSRLKHKAPDAKYQGPLLINPGGPGGSGLVYPLLSRSIPADVGDTYDWIGFDPRGVGSSEPQVSCDGDYFAPVRPSFVPETRDIEQAWLKRAKDYANACTAKYGELLDHLKTTDNVNDMESIRKALGEEKINFYGFSYGTYLGQVYSTLFPDRMRRMVFDGTVDPRRVWYDANLDQDVAFNKSIKIFFDWVAKNEAVYKLGKTGAEVEKAYYAKLAELTKKPSVIGAAEWNDAFVRAGYYVYGWADVASAFAAAVKNGDLEPIKGLYENSNGTGPGADNGYAIYLSTQCTDVKWPKSWVKWQVDNWFTYNRAPFYTWDNAWFNAPCLNWTGEAGKPVKIDGRKTQSLLLIGETYDAATPFEGGLEVRSRYPNSALIEGVGGSTHSGSLSGVECTDTAIFDYLATGKLPERKSGRRSDLQCDPVPAPDPAAAAKTSASAGASRSLIPTAGTSRLLVRD